MSEDASDRPGTIGVAVITISSESSLEDDEAGEAIVEAFEAMSHEVVTRELINRGHDNVQAKVSRIVGRDDTDIVVTVGGTGVEPRDATLEAIRPLIDKELPAFLDLFHELSYAQIGTRVVSSRALAGIAEGIPVFCLPNNTEATRLASEEIIIPEAPRLATLTGTDDGDEDEE
ncbi:MogA/MoaB family molybdenum cofactor biosynthesis protein [Natrialbaceae archaeon A-gly3]